MNVIERLQAIRVFNTHDVLLRFGGEKDVALVFQGSGGDARDLTVHGTKVYSPRFKTSPDSPWYDNGMKFFIGKQAESMLAAKAWASAQYGIMHWAPCPTDKNAKIPKRVRQVVLAALADAAPEPGESA